uniref:Tetraspanin n=1 Tax=Schistocephalus solidus TaxID=70667 RepID=A0A0X3P9G3_SCHSO
MGALYGGAKFLKFCTFFFNLIVFVCGIAVTAFGGYLYHQMSMHETDFYNVMSVTSIALMAVGTTVVVIGFLGCCGACFENVCMLVSFATIVAILLALQVTMVVLWLVYKDEAFDQLLYSIKSSFEVEEGGNRIQTNLKCCGYEIIPSIGDLPPSCCEYGVPCTHLNAYKQTCKQAFIALWESAGRIVLIVFGVLCVVQILAISVACFLQSKVRELRSF